MTARNMGVKMGVGEGNEGGGVIESIVEEDSWYFYSKVYKAELNIGPLF